jgi:2-polyprenyl-3-methyl-5-hydroxy-6-metoxy-1,4-benzoquinol methylase
MSAIVRRSHRLISRAETVVRRLLGRTVSDAARRRELETLYATPDPWRMATGREQFRFVETNRILRQALIAPAQKVGSILEIGCGEGHQGEHLALLCDRLTGIDVVAEAVARARSRAAYAELIAGDLAAQPWARERGRFDIVTGCEVLNYCEDVPEALELMSRLGRACLVTCFTPSKRVERALRAMPIAGRESFAFADVTWAAAWWRSD